MAKINRLKVVLVEKEKSGKWLADQLGKSQHVPLVNGVAIQYNPARLTNTSKNSTTLKYRYKRFTNSL